MPISLLKKLPEIVANGQREAERALDSIERRIQPVLQTREWVLPVKDSALLDWIRTSARRQPVNAQADVLPNRLINGNSLRVMAALMSGDEHTPSMRRKIDLIHVDPLTGISDDYRTDALFPYAQEAAIAIGHSACSNEKKEEIASFLAMISPQLILMRQLLNDRGSIYMRLNWHAAHDLKMLISEVFKRQDMIVREWSTQGVLLVKQENAGSENGRGITFDPKSVQEDRHHGSEVQRSASQLEDIILAVTSSESIVADFFGGAGNTAAIAEKLGRRWIISENQMSACMSIRKHLINRNAAPFLYQAIDDH